MRYLKQFGLALALLLSASMGTLAQQSAAERAASLRLQLDAIQAKQDELQARLRELDELLKPENIASALAGVGSVHPEELREQRRRTLTNEKAGVSAQLDQLAASRIRLETQLREAETNAYHQSAQPNDPLAKTKGPNDAAADAQNSTPRPTSIRRARRVKRHKAKTTRATGSPSNQ